MPLTAMRCELGVERGPGWLFVKLNNIDPDAFETHQLADQIWSLLEQHLIYRVVLEMDDVKVLRSELIAQLILLCRKIRHHDGVIRLSGLSPNNKKVLQACSLIDRLPAFCDRFEAIMGCQTSHAKETVKPR